MKDSDKILISAYLDNDLSDDELQYVEKLIDENSEAKDYLNQMKTINNEVSSFFETSIQSTEAEEISNFVNLKRNQIKNDGLLGKFSKLFDFNNPLPVYSATALLAVSIGINFYLFNESTVQEPSLLDYSNQLVERNEIKTRGVNDSYERIFKKVLLEMHKEKHSMTKLNYGSEIFQIELHKLIHEIDTLVCYEGEINSTDQKSNFVFCLDQEQQTNTFIMSSSD